MVDTAAAGMFLLVFELLMILADKSKVPGLQTDTGGSRQEAGMNAWEKGNDVLQILC